MYNYKVTLAGPLGHKTIFFTNANSALEAQANVLGYAMSTNVKSYFVECVQVVPKESPPSDVIAIHNVIPVDFKTGRRLTT